MWPMGYGVAYDRWNADGTCTVVGTIVPFNVLWGFARKAYYWLAFRLAQWYRYDPRAYGYRQGYRDGKNGVPFRGR